MVVVGVAACVEAARLVPPDGHVDQMAPFADGGGELFEMSVELYLCLVTLQGIDLHARQGVGHVDARTSGAERLVLSRLPWRGCLVADFHR